MLVAGDGKAIGITDGSLNFGLYAGQNSGESSLDFAPDAYNSSVGSNVSHYTYSNVQIAAGLTTDGSASGIVAIPTTDNNFNYIIKY